MAEHPIVAGLRWILENRTNPKGGKWTKRGLSIAAGLKSPGHVDHIIAGRIGAANLELETIEKLALAGKVSSSWLQTGEGERDLKPVKPRYPERVRALARYPDADQEVRAIVGGMQLLRAGRPTEAMWCGIIEGLMLAKLKGERLIEPSPETDDETPPIAKR